MTAPTKPIPPIPLLVIAENIPAELRGRPQWLSWSYELKKDKPGDKPEDWTKPPYVSAADRRQKASTTDPTTWSTFRQALAAPAQFDGVGFVLSKDDDYAALDLDHCRDAESGSIEPWARAIVKQFPSYWEVSPSGTGLRCIFHGRLPDTGKKKGNIEVYDRGRYVTMTGHHLPHSLTTVEPAQAPLEELLARVFTAPKAETNDNGHHPANELALDDEALIHRARRATNGAKFTALWSGDTSDHPSASEADLALCAHLAFWTNRDPARMDRLFRQSGLFRPKWDERHGAQSYGAMTITRAIDGCHDTYAGRNLTPSARLEPVAEATATDWSKYLYDAADVDAWDFPPVQFLVESLVPLLGVVWWGGMPKRFKSLLLLYLCLDVHCGREMVAGRFRILARPRMLYVAREDGGSRLKERITDICQPWGRRPDADMLRFMIRPAIDLMNPAVIDELATLCLAEGRRGLVLDTWTALSPSADPMAAKDQALLAAAVVRLAETIRGLVIVVDHSRKNRPDGQAMSSADIHGPYVKWASAEHVVMLDTVAEKPAKRIEVFIEGKDVDTDRLFLTVSARDSGEEKFAYAGSAADLAESRQAVGDTNRAAVLEVVRKAPDALTTGEIMERLLKAGKPLKKTATVGHLNALIREKKIKTSGEGKDLGYFALDYSPTLPSRTESGLNE